LVRENVGKGEGVTPNFRLGQRGKKRKKKKKKKEAPGACAGFADTAGKGKNKGTLAMKCREKKKKKKGLQRRSQSKKGGGHESEEFPRGKRTEAICPAVFAPKRKKKKRKSNEFSGKKRGEKKRVDPFIWRTEAAWGKKKGLRKFVPTIAAGYRRERRKNGRRDQSSPDLSSIGKRREKKKKKNKKGKALVLVRKEKGGGEKIDLSKPLLGGKKKKD